MHQHLNNQDRACIAALLRKKYSYCEIAHVLEVSHTTIGREVSRNSDGSGVYDARRAGRRATQRRTTSRTQYRIIDTNHALEQRIIIGLKDDWSPDQIVYRCAVSSVSSIYRYIERQPYLKRYLRRNGKRRRYGAKRIPSRYQANKRSIHDRPPITTVGHWEGDTVLGAERKLRIVTYVDKVSGYLIADKVSGGADMIHKVAQAQFKHTSV